MARRPVAMIGFGTIGRGLAALIDEGAAGPVQLACVLVRDLERVPASWRERLPGTFTTDPGVLLASSASVVVEAAGHGGLSQHGQRVLESGKDLLVVSVGALSDDALHNRLVRAAVQHGRKILIASGAIGALDAISAARLGGLESVVHTTRKPPATLLPPAEAEAVLASGQARELYHGPAREGVKRFPENVNVAAAVSLAGLGFDGTTLRVIADPAVTLNTHEVVARGYFGEVRLEIQNVPTTENPKTGRIVALSLAKALRNLAAPEVIGV